MEALRKKAEELGRISGKSVRSKEEKK